MASRVAVPAGAPQRLDTDVRAALDVPQDDPAGLSDDDYLALLTADGADLDAVAGLADELRRDAVGDDVTYVVNRNINFTNVCYVGCRFCAFAQRKTDADAYTLSLDEVGSRAAERRPRRHRGLPAGWDLPGPERHGIRGHRAVGEGGGARYACACVLAMEIANGVGQGRACRRGPGSRSSKTPGWTRSRVRRRRSSTTRSAGS